MAMKVLIGHAVMDEDGGIDGAIVGDQTGKEIATRDWYNRSGGWGVYLEPLDSAMASRAAKFMLDICGSSAFGYSQRNRWGGYQSIKANGNVVAGAATGDFDCSSLCISCYIFAGLNHKASGYTGSMEKTLLATGKFKAYRDSEHLESADYAKQGGLYIMAGKHVAMCITSGEKADTTPTYNPGTEQGDADEDFSNVPVGAYVEMLGNVRVRTGPGANFPKLFTASKGTKLPFIESEENAKGEIWYIVETDKGDGYVSSFLHKKRKYTKVVE